MCDGGGGREGRKGQEAGEGPKNRSSVEEQKRTFENAAWGLSSKSERKQGFDALWREVHLIRGKPCL